MLWQVETGQLLGEVEAHYMGVSDIDCCDDMVITGGKDSKVKVFILTR
jgi:hypothetical protein